MRSATVCKRRSPKCCRINTCLQACVLIRPRTSLPKLLPKRDAEMVESGGMVAKIPYAWDKHDDDMCAERRRELFCLEGRGGRFVLIGLKNTTIYHSGFAFFCETICAIVIL